MHTSSFGGWLMTGKHLHTSSFRGWVITGKNLHTSSFEGWVITGKNWHTSSFGGWVITGKNPVSDLQVPTSEFFMLKTVHEPIRVQGGDPSLVARIAATDIAQSICKRLSIKSRWRPLYSFTKGISSGFPILYFS